MENILYVQKTTAGNVDMSENVVFDSVLINSGSITYNSTSGEITLNDIGKYHINWWIATQAVNSSVGAVFALSASNGALIKGNSPTNLNSFTGLGIVDVTLAPVTIKLVNSSDGRAYLASTTQIKAMLSVDMVIDNGSSDTMYNFQMLQLANVISQIITLYPENTISVFVRGLYFVTGTPQSLYSSHSGAGLFVVLENEEIQAIPLNMITAIDMGVGSVYNPSISYLSAPTPLPTGWDAGVITSVYDYLPVSSPASVFFGIGTSSSGFVFKNELGMLVVTTDLDGNNPTFIPASESSIILTSGSTSKSEKKTSLKKIELL